MVQVSEERLLADVERRLVDEFPRISTDDVGDLLRQEHARFRDSRIRDFVTLLAEKRARDELKRRLN
ncbi:hypothetical protein A5713_10445 [Mycobacterium sp. E2497]|nr:hypothetical protein A9X04_08715 [Mycobacterium sp. E3247]OBI22766.1 hypothetical protein A5713_10445 [Mycobacterium sp. E2497]